MFIFELSLFYMRKIGNSWQFFVRLNSIDFTGPKQTFRLHLLHCEIISNDKKYLLKFASQN